MTEDEMKIEVLHERVKQMEEEVAACDRTIGNLFRDYLDRGKKISELAVALEVALEALPKRTVTA